MKHNKKIIQIVVVIIVLSSFFLVKYLVDVKKYQTTVSNMTFSDIDIKGIPNGVYKGECNVNYIYAKVSVSVKDGVITDLKLMEHKNERGATAEKIVDDILDKQTVNVDAISGATNSSKVIKKAVENALRR
jgi:uncharacterized protein with FMN-binding domain